VVLWRNLVVIRQVLAAVGAGVGAVWLLMVVIAGADGELGIDRFWSFTRIFLMVFAGLVVLAFLVMALFYRRYQYRFELDEQGASASTVAGTRKKNAVVNALLVLTGRPSAMGAGMLAGSRQDQRVLWEELDGFRVHRRRPEIALKRGRRTTMLIRCTNENFEMVRRFIRDRVRRKEPGQRRQWF